MKKLNMLVTVTILVLSTGFNNAESTCKPCVEAEYTGNPPEYLSLVPVEKSLLIKHLVEGIEHKEIFSIKYKECDFSILYQEPDDREYIQIDRNTSMITSIALDREDEAFSNMLVPQIQVELLLDCPTTYLHYNRMQNANNLERSYINYRNSKNYPTKFGDRSYVLSRDIKFSPKTMMLSIIIEDENDNHPLFIYPPSSNFLIGYPEAVVSEDLFPDYLLKVRAVDKDADLNSKIRYRVRPNDHFDINPETGEVYPFENALWDTEQVVLRVYATDRNGAADGKETSLDIRVRKICTDHLVLLTIENESAFEAEKALELVKHKTGIHFNVLKKGFRLKRPQNDSLSTPENSTLFQQPVRKVVLRAWIYGFDSNGEPLVSSVLEAKVSEIGKEISVSAISHAKVKNITDERNNVSVEPETITYLVVAIIILLIIIIGLIVAFITWYCIRLHRHNRMHSPSNSTATTISSISSDIETQRSSMHGCHSNSHHVYHKRDSLLKNRENGCRNSAGHNRNSILKGRSSLPEPAEIDRFTQKLHHILGDISELQGSTINLDQHKILSEKRKSSVTFNDNIQFFNIDDDIDGQGSVNSIRL